MHFAPLVSIIIPVFNGSNYLNEAIDSALMQTYKNIEIIVINDGSIDDGQTEKISLSYGQRIRYFSKPNGGVASALNLGIQQMQGEYFSWLSHDDIYYPEKIEAQINYLGSLKNWLSIVYSDFCFIDQNSKHLSNFFVKKVSQENFRTEFIKGGLTNGCTLLVPKQCFEICGTFNERLKTTQDYELWFRFTEKFTFIYLPKILVKTRIHQNQDTQKLKPTAATEGNKLYIHFIKSLRISEIKSYYNKTVPIYYLDFSMRMFENQLFKAANFSFTLALLNFWRIKGSQVYEALSKIKSILKSNFKVLLKLKY